MSKPITTAEIRAFAKRLGLTCETNNPGDGVRRFEFIFNTSPTTTHHAFCYGAREAWFWLKGFEQGQDYLRGALTVPVNDAIFVVETVAHLRGLERDLLPLADKLRLLVG